MGGGLHSVCEMFGIFWREVILRINEEFVCDVFEKFSLSVYKVLGVFMECVQSM